MADGGPCGSDSVVKSALITISTPTAPTATDGERCGTGSVTLTAAGSGGGDLEWYATATGGSSLGTGTTFNTPSISTPTTYYVQEVIPGPPGYVGPANNSVVGGGGYHNNSSTQYLEFTVLTPVTIVSAWVNANSSGNRTFNLWDGSGGFITSLNINIPSGTSRVNLDLDLTPGNYRIGGSWMDLYRNNSGPAYPYDLAGSVSITGSSAGSSYYYYLYDWEIKGEDCISTRTAALATVNPGPTADFTYVTSLLDVDFTDASVGSISSWYWDFGDGATSTSPSPSHTYTTSGTYNVMLIVDNGSGCSDTTYQTVNVSQVGLDDIKGLEALEIYPNPFNSELNVAVDFSVGGQLSVSMTNLLSQESIRIFEGEIQPGRYTYKWENSLGISEGVYLLKISLDNQTTIKKLIHIKK